DEKAVAQPFCPVGPPVGERPCPPSLNPGSPPFPDVSAAICVSLGRPCGERGAESTYRHGLCLFLLRHRDRAREEVSDRFSDPSRVVLNGTPRRGLLAKERSTNMANTTKDKLENAAGQATQKAKDVASNVADKAKDLAAAAADKADSALA